MSNTTYTESLNNLDDRENQNYEENKKATKSTGVHLRKLEKIYERSERNGREPPGTITLMANKRCTLLL